MWWLCPGDGVADVGKAGKPVVDEVWKLIKSAAKKLVVKEIDFGTLVMNADCAFRTHKRRFHLHRMRA